MTWLLWLALRVFVFLARKPNCTFKDPETGSDYLTRWWLGKRSVWPDSQGRTGGQGWYLHCFHRSDYARDLHSHPSRFTVCLILRGGYLEERREGLDGELFSTSNRPGKINVLFEQTFHRTELIGNSSWSLVYMGPRSGGWGFAKGSEVVRADHFDGRSGDLVKR